MTDRLMEQYAGPAGAEHHFHFPRRGRLRLKIDQGLTQGFVHLAAPSIWGDKLVIRFAPAGAGRA